MAGFPGNRPLSPGILAGQEPGARATRQGSHFLTPGFNCTTLCSAPTPNSSHNPPCPPQSPAIAISQPRSMIFPPTGAVSSTPPTSATHGTALPSSPRPADTHKRKCQQHTLHLGCYSRSFKVASSPLQSRRPPPRHDTRPLGRQKAM